MNSETIPFSIYSNYSKLSAPLSTKVPEQTDWEVRDFYQTMTNGRYNYNHEERCTSSCNMYYSPHETLLDILSIIEQKENKYHEYWQLEQEDSTTLPDLEEDQSEDESFSYKSSESIHTDNTLILSRTSTIKDIRDTRTELLNYAEDTSVKKVSFPKKKRENSLNFISPLKHVCKKQKLNSATRPLSSTSFFHSLKEIKRLTISKCFIK